MHDRPHDQTIPFSPGRIGFAPSPTFQPIHNKIWIEAYGCTASIGDSEIIKGLLEESGYALADKEDDSGLSIVVTCSVKDVTEHRMLHRLNQLSKARKPLIIAGCLPKANHKLLETLYPRASFIGPHSIEKTVDVVKASISGKIAVHLEDSKSDKINLPKVRSNSVTSIIQIASGCMSECTFCQTKLAKGQLRSYRIGDIVRQFQHDVNDGCKEIWLTSTDNGCYGRDIGSDLIDLLESCVNIPGDYKIRIGMMNPMFLKGMIGRMVELLWDSDKIFKFLHIPVQSGSNFILRKMKRGHTAEVFVDAVKAFRTKIPEVTIATDVIVGFPSETENDFDRTVQTLRLTEPDIVNVSKYGARPGTAAAAFKKEDTRTTKSRSEQLHRLVNEIALKRNFVWKAWEGIMIIDGSDGDWLYGRNYAYKPIHVMGPRGRNFRVGDKVSVRIQEFTSHYLKGCLQNIT